MHDLLVHQPTKTELRLYFPETKRKREIYWFKTKNIMCLIVCSAFLFFTFHGRRAPAWPTKNITVRLQFVHIGAYVLSAFFLLLFGCGWCCSQFRNDLRLPATYRYTQFQWFNGRLEAQIWKMNVWLPAENLFVFDCIMLFIAFPCCLLLMRLFS
jgi:hypothetical protein